MSQQIQYVNQTAWFKAPEFYNQSIQSFIYGHATPAMLERVAASLKNTQFIQQHRESHPVWRIPIKVIYETSGGRMNMGVFPNLAKSHLIGIEGLDAADTGRLAHQQEFEV